MGTIAVIKEGTETTIDLAKETQVTIRTTTTTSSSSSSSIKEEMQWDIKIDSSSSMGNSSHLSILQEEVLQQM